MILTIISELGAGSGQKQIKTEHTGQGTDDVAFGVVLAAADNALETIASQNEETATQTSADAGENTLAAAGAPEEADTNAAIVSAPGPETTTGVRSDPVQPIPKGSSKEPTPTKQLTTKNDARQIAKDILRSLPSETAAASAVEASLERSSKVQTVQGARFILKEGSQSAQRAVAIGAIAKPATNKTSLPLSEQLKVENAAVTLRGNEIENPTLVTTTNTSTAPAAVALARRTTLLDIELVEKSPITVASDATTGLASSDRAQFSPTAQTTGQPPATPEAARQAASQIAVAVSNATGKTTEITLNPEELGRVRLSLKASDGAIILNVSAERPETQDLLRRHIDALAQEFRQLGYSSISFSFEQQNNTGHAQDQHPDEASEQEIQSLAAIPQTVSKQITSGLDLRI